MTDPVVDRTELNEDDPFFLHHSDSPGLVLVSQILVGDNYVAWSLAMKIALSIKNKLGFIDGSLPRPDNSNPSHLKLWIRNNNAVRSWILNSVAKHISASLIYHDSAYGMWKELKERFDQGNGPRIFQIKRDLMNLMQGQDSVSTYYTKLKVLWEELANYNIHCSCGRCTCGGAREMEQGMNFLMGLNESYSQVRGQILLMDPLPSVNRIFSLIVQEERQRSVGASQVQNQSMAFNIAANQTPNQQLPNQTQNQFLNVPTGRFQDPNQPMAFNIQGSGSKEPRNQKLFCTHCKRSGHTQEKCHRLHGFPPGYKTNQYPRANYVLDTQQVSNENSSGVKDVVDGLTSAQPQQLMTALSGKLASVNMASTSAVKVADNSVDLVTVADHFIDLGGSRDIKSVDKVLVASDETRPKEDLRTLKILSYNVWKADIELCIRMKAIGDIIQLHSPDVICLQEVTPDIYAIFQRSNWWKSYKRSLSFYNAIPRPNFCMQLSKLPVKSFICKQFSYSAMGRELCIAEVSVHGDTPLVVATSHLESPGRCLHSPKWDMHSKERVPQANEAVDFLKKNPNVIFCGDLNWIDNLDGEFPLPEGWIDAWTELKPKETGWTFDTKSNLMLSANHEVQQRLDRFLTSLRDFKVERIDMVGTEPIPGVTYMKQKRWKELELPVFPSDHFGLLLTMIAR